MYLADGGGGAPARVSVADAQQMSVEVETLKQFRAKVDGLLHDLDAGPASTREIAGQHLASAHFGDGFTEVGTLSEAYATAHGKLQELSTALSQQIEAMSITVDYVQNGYTGVEESQVEALWRIHDRTQTAYRKVYGPNSASRPAGSPAASASPSPSASPSASSTAADSGF